MLAKDFSNKKEVNKNIVIISGANSMIGEACAHLFSKNHITLILVGRSLEKLKSLEKKLPGKHKLYSIDMLQQVQIQNMMEEIHQTFGNVDGLVQNIGIYPLAKIENLTIKDWKDTLDTNLTSSFIMTQEVFKLMQAKKRGKIIFMSSIAGETIGLPSMASYASSKAGLIGLMRTAAIEFAKYGIHVNSISPGKVWDTNTLSSAEQEQKLKCIPLKKFVDPAHVAQLAHFLISDKAQSITGQNFIIDGGQSILGEDSHII
jgi:3-oxoacyl-[acyl-carrier protein] reductase